ncbi:MAG: penicillin-binding protein 2 [Frankiales bacterium]|nr:penicillin-binding protein 2 [Frankiales bacterium]
MSDRSRLRIVVLRVVVASILLTLIGRLTYLQVAEGVSYSAAAKQNRIRTVITPAARGQILDDKGRALVTNRTALVVSVTRSIVRASKDRGTAELARLSKIVGLPVKDITTTISPCVYHDPSGKQIPLIPGCWNGSPYQPVPIASYNSEDAAQVKRVLAIAEHQELFPGVTAEYQAVREYPGGTLAAHVLGYLGPLSSDDTGKPKYKDLPSGTEIGRTGVEQVYDDRLRGTLGQDRLLVDKDGSVVGTRGTTTPVAGDNLVLSIDAGVQKVAEKALADGIANIRKQFDKNRGKNFVAPGGAAIVVEVSTGRIVAMASNPTYDPTAFVGHISPKVYASLSNAFGHPLISNAVQGLYAPGSTFKIVSTAAAVKAGYSLGGYYPCPGQFLGKRNFEGESFASLNFTDTLIRSCDTVYYKLAYEQWLKDGKREGVAHPKEYFPKEARIWGFGKKTGIDLPDERVGLITDRAYKKAFWLANKDKGLNYCKGAKTRPKGTYQQQADAEFCADGYALNGGDAMNFAIGQGDVLVTPLQLAMAYSALVNGGTLFHPQLAKGFVSADGRTSTTLPPKVAGHVDTPANVRAYIASALGGVPHPPHGTAKGAYAGFPFGQLQIGGKTGTADVNNKAPTSWFASFAPLDKPKYVTVVMVPEASTGGTTAGPISRKIWDGIYGLEGQKAQLPGGVTPASLPVVRNDGTIGPPGTKVVRPALSPSPSSGPTALGAPGLEWAYRREGS